MKYLEIYHIIAGQCDTLKNHPYQVFSCLQSLQLVVGVP